MKIKVVCVDCSASVDWEEDDLDHFICPKCECDDYNFSGEFLGKLTKYADCDVDSTTGFSIHG